MFNLLAVPAVTTIVSAACIAIGPELSTSSISSAAILQVVTIGISVEDNTALIVRSTALLCRLFAYNSLTSASKLDGQVYTVVAPVPVRSCPVVRSLDSAILRSTSDAVC